MRSLVGKNGAILTLLGMLSLGSSSAQDGIPYPDALRESNVTLSRMHDAQGESLMVGNGDFYGIVWEKDGGLFMRITKNDIWDARLDTSKDGDMPRVDIVSGEVSDPYNTLHSYHTLPYPHPRCAAALRLGPVPEAMSAHLDIRTASVSVHSASRPLTTLRILHDRNVLLIKSPHAVTLEAIKADTLPDPTLGTSGGVSWLLMKMPGDMDYRGMDYAVAVASKGSLKAVSLVTSFDIRTGDVLEQAVALAEDTLKENEVALIAAHERAWEAYWSRSGLELADKTLQNWWYRMLYFAGTVCKHGAAPVGLMPPLATDATPWHADYHHNYNSWQAFWPLPAANQSELADPWISYNHNMIPRYKYLAQETYGIDGIHVAITSFLHEPDPATCKSKNKRQVSNSPYGLTIGLQAMTLQSMWQKYLCDQNTEYMKVRIYPFVRETGRFYTSFMEKCKKDKDGKILLGPSYSPEHGEAGIYNCPFDIAYVHYAFDAFIQAATTLKTDKPLVDKCRKYKALLPPYPTAEDKSGKPIVVDWKGCKYKQIEVHNLTVPAFPVFPADQVTWFSPEEDKELFKRTIRDTRFNGNNAHVMFNIAKARLSMPEAVSDAKTWFTSRELPNGFFKWQGHEHGTFMPEMIGIAGLIDEFLLQSVQDKIRLFPCWPMDQNAKFSRLRAQGGFIVSAEFRDGHVVSATIKSVAEKQLQLHSPWESIHVNGRRAVIASDGLVTLNAKPGQIFLFTETRQK